MEVIIDGQRNFEFRGEPAGVLEALAAITDHLRAQRRGMLSLTVDGESIQPVQVSGDLEDRPLSSVGVIEVTSEALGNLARNVLQELGAVLPDLPRVCRELAAVFHGDSPEDGYDPFTELARIWAHIKQQELLVVEALDLDLDALQVGGVSAKQMHTELNQFLEEAADALKNGDTVLLGDLLEYELAVRAEKEAELVALLQERVPPTSG